MVFPRAELPVRSLCDAAEVPPVPAIDLRDVSRIAVVGCCGAGKSTLATRLALATGLPVVHLDREYWRPGWVEPDGATWDAHHGELIAESHWIVDGNFGGTMRPRIERAELVVQLVVPTHVALWRVISRSFRHWSRARPDMAPGCVERPLQRRTLSFWHYVATYNRRGTPAVTRLLDELAADRWIVVRSGADADALVAELAAVR